MKKSILFSILAILIAGLGFGKIVNHVNAENNYSEEFYNAYNFAYENGITTVKNINDAQMNGPLTRIAMAKMLSNYAINVLDKQPDTSKIPYFTDVTKKLDSQYNNGVTLAYQLGIMGVGVQNFRPYDTVTRAEFCTALSRMLYGLEDGTDNYYSTHIKKLAQEGIISNNNPQLNEKRGYVMLMLMRSQKSQSNTNKNSNTVSNNTTTHETENKIPKPQPEKTNTTANFITHSTVNGINLLTICNPNNSTECLTMMDRNLGATTNNINNTGSYGYKYQWGNNYGFMDGCRNEGCSDNVTLGSVGINTNGVKWKSIYDNNGYYGNLFIKGGLYGYWSDNQRHTHLRGGGNDEIGNNWGYPVTNANNRQGPCPNGYHVSSVGERKKVVERWTLQIDDSSLENPDTVSSYDISDHLGAYTFRVNFNIPGAGIRDWNDGTLHFGDSYLWTSTAKGNYSPSSYHFGLYEVVEENAYSASSGMPIRCFKNPQIIVDNSPIVTHSTTNGIGVLTICNPEDNTECLTMMDKNLGATTNNINNTGSYGYKYQWGNNYGFSRIEDLTIQESPVNAKGYGPYNYYNSNTFIASNIIPHDRSSIRNDNLWGGELDNFDDNYLGYPFHNPTDRKGPCPNGYHVPSMGERFKVMEWWAGKYSLEHNNVLEYDEYNKPYISSGEGELAFTSDFLIPHSSYFYINRPMYGGATTVTEDGAHTDMFSILRTSSPTPYTSGYGGDFGFSNIVEESRDSWALHFLSNHYIIGAAEPREMAAPVRCFKN